MPKADFYRRETTNEEKKLSKSELLNSVLNLIDSVSPEEISNWNTPIGWNEF